jgi:hypothetical protein
MNNSKITSTFKLVFGTVVGLTMLSGGTAFSLAAQEQLSPQQTRVFETCSATWQMGVGAVFGLLGSKATDLFYLEQEGDSEQE